jgi:hypothetical protein
MTMKTISCYVDVDVDLDDFDDDELVYELEQRGWSCTQDDPDTTTFDNDDWQMLIDIVDKMKDNWQLRRVREKLVQARYG